MSSTFPSTTDYPLDPDEKLVLADRLEEQGESWELIAWLRLHATGTVKTQSTPFGGVYVGKGIVGLDWKDPLKDDYPKVSTWDSESWVHPNPTARTAIEWLVEKAMKERT